MRGGAGGCRSPRDSRGGGRGARGRYRDRQETTRGAEGAEQERTEETAGTVTEAGGKRKTSEDLPARRRDTGAGGKYRGDDISTEESTDESAE